ncbi:TIGR03016 family PEP-CTERM system-associated outer membrane protein [Vibrio sp. Of7-15]|uniref:TIGR03016 family PEP-CTERM system-associated outer membrane protein n=1 Tax=Vibrio sp. Of7-15 TaxID=2724879 RepID=UPI001EF2640C|nr:TIGR03016 family PEP-CTERM system-associated outer membrane protein [Vibrio sp. Of7-15]MCG7495360.1 TIGR03016 family PEP-CTERM system-associated outer membrane protein [Vibrio sp. Of7-15]
MLAMDLATVTVITQRQNHRSKLAYCVLFLPFLSYAEEWTLTPDVGVDFVQTDNIERSHVGPQSGSITTVNIGTTLDVEGRNQTLNLSYDGRQVINSHDSEENQFFNQLSFDYVATNRASSMQFGVHGNVDNIAERLDGDAVGDILTGSTVETKQLSADAQYQSNPRKALVVSGGVETSIERNEDSVGNNNSYSGNISVGTGRAEKHIFSNANYTFERKSGQSSSQENTSETASAEVGLTQYKGFSPLVRVNDENFDDSQRVTSAQSSYIGPALRYYLDKVSYFELNYNFPIDDDNNDDYLGGAIRLEPSQRTQLYLEYSQRFFGDAYEVDFSHRSRRWTNSVNYSEDPVSFRRDLLVSGNDISELTLLKSLSWVSELALRRGTLSFEANYNKTETIIDNSTNRGSQSEGGLVSWGHSLSRSLELDVLFSFEKFDFDASVLQSSQTDYYRELGITLTQQLKDQLSVELNSTYVDKSSSDISSSYDELRARVNVSKQF